MKRRHPPVAANALLLCCLCVLCESSFLQSADPCQSGLQPGQRPMPYAFVLSTGPQRGVSHCYICETADKPAVLIFARSLSDPLGKLAQKLDRAVAEHKKADLRSWITFLSEDQLSLDSKVVAWSKKFALRSLS